MKFCKVEISQMTKLGNLPNLKIPENISDRFSLKKKCSRFGFSVFLYQLKFVCRLFVQIWRN